jgi:endonuclease G, mitochondrial
MEKVKLNHRASFKEMKRLGEIINGTTTELEGNPISKPEKFEGRIGYEPAFLEGWEINLPMAFGGKAKDMLKLRDSNEVELKYVHFSVIMSKSRKLSLLTATNIDGTQSKKIGRSDKWFLDGRIDENQQFGNELYLHNRLDRGHMVRREDPVWGSDAENANLDTFHYTNSCPQMDVFNQQTWLGLENYILQNARVNKLKVSVFTGPFFTHNDITYNEARIPNAFWKVIAFLKEDGTPSATAYKISQERELTELEFSYGAYKTYQISIQDVIDNTSIDFSELEQYDGFTQHEIESSVNNFKIEIRDFNEIMI